jgi:hypothetical protein
VPPGRACKDVPAPRVRQRTQIRVTQDFVPPDATPDLATARAAGSPEGALPWPVLVAQLGTGCAGAQLGSLINYHEVRYARHRAAKVSSPTARADMQLGLSSLTDIYHFLVSTRGDAKYEKRLGVDRDGTTQVWRPLRITGPIGAGEAMLATGHAFRFTGRMPAGLTTQLEIVGSVDAKLRSISARLVGGSSTLWRLGGAAPVRKDLSDRATQLSFSGVFAPSVKLLDLPTAAHPRQPIAFSKARRTLRGLAEKLQPAPAAGAAVAAPLAGSPAAAAAVAAALAAAPGTPAPIRLLFSAIISPQGGHLSPLAVQFRPAAKLDADPELREIYAVTTSGDEDPVPRTELRVSGGGADDSDASGRVSVGARTDAGYAAALRIDGGGRVRLLSGAGVKEPAPLLEVEGTTYLPPVGKKDPMLPDLLALAFISGQMQIGNVISKPNLLLEEPAAAGKVYKLTVSDLPPAPVFKSILELIYGNPEDGPADMTVRTLEGVQMPSGNGSKTTTEIAVPGLAPTGRRVVILVLMLVETGGKTRAVRSNLLRMEIP